MPNGTLMRKFEDVERNYLELFPDSAFPTVTLNREQQNDLIDLMRDAIIKNRPILEADMREYFGGPFGNIGVILSPEEQKVDFDEDAYWDQKTQDYLTRNKQ